MARPGFVGAEGTRFSLDGRPFVAAGANCYYLGFCPPDEPAVLESALDTAAAFGVNVLRIWAFLEAEQWGCRFQTFDGARIVPVSGADGLDRLDAAVLACAARGIRVILTLANSMPDYGGMDQYVRWLSPGAATLYHDEFYDREDACRAYEEWTRYLLTRPLGATGHAYKDEPAILAWELANEPRCTCAGNLPARADCPGSRRIEQWADRMSRHLKSIDPDHLVAVGDEGWFGENGVDTEALLRLPAIDFGTCHLYPESWNVPAKKWIRSHRKLARKIGKPMLVEEFGLLGGPDRDATYAEWVGEACGDGGAGALVWMIAGNDPSGAPYHDDGFTLYDAAGSPRLAEALRTAAADD